MSDLTNQYIIAQEEHDYNKKYEEGTIVKHTIYGVTTAYSAKKNVPKFISILNENYWKKISSTDEGGTVDYDNLKNKPTINGVELDGNKTSSDLGVYSKPSGGIPQSDLSSDVQSQLNKHFKGWLTSTSQLPSNPQVGDYAYVKEDGTTYIYRCITNGEWPSTSTEEKDPVDVTFADGREVNEVHIINDLTTGGIEDVLSAEQGKILKQELTQLDQKVFLKDSEIITSLGLINFTLDADRPYYSTTGIKQYDAGNYKRTLPIEVDEDEVVTFNAECNTGNCVVAALDSNGDFISEASVAGTTNNTNERTYTVPSGVKYLVFCNRYVSSPYVLKQGEYKGEVKLDSNKISNANEVAKYVNGKDNYPGILPLEILKPEYCRMFNGYFGIVNNALKLYTGEDRNHVVCRVTPGQTIELTSSDSSHRVAVFLFASYYNEDNKDISKIILTSDTTNTYIANSNTVSFNVPFDTYYLSFNITGNYNFPSKVVINGNDVTNSFLKIISDYNTLKNQQWQDMKSVSYLTGATVDINNASIKLSGFIPIKNDCVIKAYSECNTESNYGFALYSTANESSFVQAQIFKVEHQKTNGTLIIYVPKEANYIRLTYHTTRNPNPHIEYNEYAQDEKLFGATPIKFIDGISGTIGSSFVVGATNIKPAISEDADYRFATIDCKEGEVYTINGYIYSTLKVYAIVDAEDNVLAVSSSGILQNEIITIPTGGKFLYINTRKDAPMSYKGICRGGSISLWQGEQSVFDDLSSYENYRLHIDNYGNILNTDNTSIVGEDLEKFMKVNYADDLVNYDYSYAYIGAVKDIPRPVLIPVCTNRGALYNGAIFKLFDFDNNLVYTETISSNIYKYIIKVWNLQPDRTYKWELNNSSDTITFDKGIVTPQGYPRWIKVMDLGMANRVENVRDLGGWKVDWNKHVKFGMIIRGSDMNWGHTIDADGITVLKDNIGVGYDLDLRNSMEYSPFLEESPLGSDVEWGNFPVTAYTITSTSGTLYANAIKQIVSNLSDGIVTYFHCKAGADRTGTLSALILGILGVSEADLSKEYELTNGRNRSVVDEQTNRAFKNFIATVKTYIGNTFQDKVISWATEFGVTTTEINTLKSIMITE